MDDKPRDFDMVKTGSRILITRVFLNCGQYDVGDILIVKKVGPGGQHVRVKGVSIVIGDDEFEVVN